MQTYTRGDIGGELELERERLESDRENVGEDCKRCSREYGHRVLCDACETEQDEIREEIEEVEAEEDRRLAFLNRPFYDMDMTFGEALDEAWVYFAWDALQDMVYFRGHPNDYTEKIHEEFASNVLLIIQRKDAQAIADHLVKKVQS